MVELSPGANAQAEGAAAHAVSAAGSFRYEMKAGGAVKYSPPRADPSRGFGPYEVHPQMVQVVRDNCARLEHNGEWLVLFSEGEALQYLAITEARGGRVTAERLAAVRNEGAPTRIVDLAGDESTSKHTSESVRAELAAAGVADV